MLTVYWYAVGVVEETDKRTTSNKEHYIMGIARADFDGVVAALGFPSEKERKVIEHKVALVAEACDQTWIILPFLTALYGALMDIWKAEGADHEEITLADFLNYLRKHDHPTGFALERVFDGGLITHMPVGDHYYTEQEWVFKVSNEANVAIAYVRINEEKFYVAATGEREVVSLYINAL